MIRDWPTSPLPDVLFFQEGPGLRKWQWTVSGMKLVLDWRKQQQSRAAVRVAVETELDQLPRKYDIDLFQVKCDIVYQHIYDNYLDNGHNTYAAVA